MIVGLKFSGRVGRVQNKEKRKAGVKKGKTLSMVN